MRRAEECDVVIVGAGAGGLMAAIEAADVGADVIVLQKLPEPGGKCSLAIGSISAAGTSLQRARGTADSVERFRADIERRVDTGGLPSQSRMKLETVIERGPAAVERLLELGVTFSGPHPEIVGEPARLHVIYPSTHALVATLSEQVRRRGVKIRGDWAVDRLLTDEAGAIRAVEGELGLTRARRGVVLATGDFSSPSRLDGMSPDGSALAFRPWSTGDGQMMAQAVGAHVSGLDESLSPQLRTLDWPHIALDPSVFEAGALLVDRSGSRFCNELGDVAAQTVSADVEDAFVVFDRNLLDRIATADEDSPGVRDGWLRTGKLYLATFPGLGYAYVEDLVRAGYAFVEPTVRSLAAKLGISSGQLQYELAAGDAMEPPFFGCGPWQSRVLLGLSGVDVDDEMRVLRSDGASIAGLFGAGAVTGPTSYGQGHGFGLAWAIVSGRTAGQAVAK